MQRVVQGPHPGRASIREAKKVENYRSHQTMADDLRGHMSAQSNRINIRQGLLNFLSRFKGTPREAEARQAINDWIDRNRR